MPRIKRREKLGQYDELWRSTVHNVENQIEKMRTKTEKMDSYSVQ